MAARENQGLQIALIVFVLFTLLLSVTTFVFVRKANTETARAETAETSASKERQDRTKIEGERGQLMQYVGVTANDKIEAATEAWDKDMKSAQAFGVANLPADQQTYKKLVEGYKAVVQAKSAQLTKQEEDFRASKTTYENESKKFQERIAALEKEKETVLADYMKARADIESQVESLRSGQKEIARQSLDKDKAIDTLKSQMDAKISDIQKQLDNSERALGFKSEKVIELEGKFNINARADGEIISVSRDRTVFINLGSADGLRKRVTFSVFDPSTTDVSAIAVKDEDGNPIGDGSKTVSEAHKKGSIEVINVTQPHMAECRIISDTIPNPLLPGDLIFTPLWRPGKQDHFAFVGLMDLDGDGKADREKIRELIRAHGGIIDAEIDDKGNLVGEVTPATRYVVKGSAENVANRTGSNKLIEDATKLGVESVDLAKFLDMTGYTPPLGDDKIVRGRSPTPPDPGTPANNFRARVPPERGNKGGGF